MRRIMMVFALTIIFNACTPAQQPSTPQSELESAILNMLSFIDQGKSQELLAKFIDMSEMEEPRTDITDEGMRELRFLLLRTKELSPEFFENESVAIYTDSSFPNSCKFTRINNKWMLTP